MPSRVSPIDRIRAEIDDRFGDPNLDLAEALEDVARLSVRLALQTVLEEEVTEFLGRDRYQRHDSTGEDVHRGSRNGHSNLTIKTTSGPVTLDRPKLRGCHERFTSKLFGKRVARTKPLEALVISAWVRGLSDRDVKAMLAEALGSGAALSPSTVSRICRRLKDDFEVWKKRDLSDFELDYLFLDGSHFRMHADARAEPVLVAYGVGPDGKPVLLHVAAGGTESTGTWADFCEDMVKRGLRSPLFVASDGNQGLINAVETTWGRALRQRCLIHRSRNVIAKVPVEHQDEVKLAFWECFDDIDADPGQDAVDEAKRRIGRFATRFRGQFPSAVGAMEVDTAALCSHLRLPREHWRRVRHTNLIERTFGETRRRVKVIGRLPGENTCLTLVWAVLERASAGWNGVTATPVTAAYLTRLRADLYDPPSPDLTGNGDERTGELTDTAETTNGVGETSDVDEATQAA